MSERMNVLIIITYQQRADAASFNMGMLSKFMLLSFPIGPKAFRLLNRQFKRLQNGRLKK